MGGRLGFLHYHRWIDLRSHHPSSLRRWCAPPIRQTRIEIAQLLIIITFRNILVVYAHSLTEKYFLHIFSAPY
jgi:hypothetical protein